MQDNRLSEFRQALFAGGFTRRRDAQKELLDALLLSGPTNSFAELILSPAFRRQWPSAYAAVADGRQNTDWIERHLSEQVPSGSRQKAGGGGPPLKCLPSTRRLGPARKLRRSKVAALSTALRHRLMEPESWSVTATRCWLG